MDYDILTAQYKSNLHKNEREMDELLSLKRKLEDERQDISEWKRHEAAHCNQRQNELHDKGAKQYLQALEKSTNFTVDNCKRMERILEQGLEEIARKRKQLSAERETLQSEYRREVRNINKGGIG